MAVGVRRVGRVHVAVVAKTQVVAQLVGEGRAAAFVAREAEAPILELR